MVELGSGVASGYCGRLLAGVGADVVKIEPPEGDALRREGPFPGDIPHRERSGMHLHLDAGKRSVVLAPAERDDRDRLLAGSDAVLLSGRPGELRAAALAPDVLRRRFPALVVTCVSTFGQSGPYAEYLGGELVAYALGGYASLTGAPGRQPLKAYGHLVEYQAGAHAALGTLAALHARAGGAGGQVVDVSAMDAATFLIGAVQQPAHFYGRIARRNGTRLLGFPPEHSYPSTIRPCRDGYVHAHSHNRHLELLASLIPHPRLSDPEVLHAMLGHADEIDAIMDDWLRDRGRFEVVRQAQELRLPFTEVLTPGEVLADEHNRGRGSFVELEHPAVGTVRQVAGPMRLSTTPWQSRPAPALGQHTAEVLRESRLPAHPPALPQRRRPLEGYRVVDFTNAVAGPIATAILGDLGADVIKVEAPNARPRVARGTAPLKGEVDLSYNRIMTYNELNRSKRGVTLDVAEARGRELFLRLVAQSDVVVQNFSPRVMHNLELDYDSLRAVNPAIILVSMPAFGLDGPYRDRIAYGPGIDAMSGLSHLTGYADGPPMKPGNFFCDQQAAVLSAFATEAALWYRRATGEGQHIELAMIEGEFQLVADAYLDYTWNRRERMRAGNDHPRFAPHDTYRCDGEDAWVAIAVEDDLQWQRLCTAIDRPGLASDARFATRQARHANREALRPLIEAWTATRTHYACQEALQSAGVPAGAALNCLELLHDPHIRARETFQYVDVPGVGPSPYPRVAFTLDETPCPITKPAPGFADDNDAVFGGLLSLDEAEIAALELAGIAPRVPAGDHSRR